MKLLVTAGALMVCLATGITARAASASGLLEKGIYTEETKGDLEAASLIYQQIVDDRAAGQNLAAQAQLRLALCELKRGNKPQAVSVLERLTREFPDKDKLLAIVDKQMPRLLDEMVKQIENNYIREVDRGELMETAIRAIIGKLDSRADFIAANEMQELNNMVGQKIAGIGARLSLDKATREIVVDSPLPGSPALKGGVLAGDRIVAINGGALSDTKPLETAVSLLRGPAGTPVVLAVKRAGSSDAISLTLVRDTVRLPSVLGDTYGPNHEWNFMLDAERKIGCLRLTYLGQESFSEMQAALEALQRQGMTGLILDLRNGPGGLLSEAVKVADLFLTEGRIVTVKGRGGDQAHDAKANGTFSGFPMAVLVNRKTASAAEIVASSLQDHHRAVVVGERTIGEGLVKSIFQLQGGIGALKLPTGAYYRPSGKSMHRYPDSKESDDWGVRPDPGYEVVFNDEELQQYEKQRSQRDIMNPGESTPAAIPDRQLQRALEALAAPPGGK